MAEMKHAAALADQMDESRKWTLRLVEDFHGDEWGFQPAPAMAHPLWLCGHIAVAQNALVFNRCLGLNELDRKFAAHFPIGQAVIPLSEHAYPTPADVLDVMSDMHSRALAAVGQMSEALLAEPAYAQDGESRHPHYRDKYGAVAHVARHEAFHAGQIAVVRRMLGKPFLR
jgi:hypothetical protein